MPDPEVAQLEEHLLHCDECCAFADTISADDALTAAIRARKVIPGDGDTLAEAIERAKQLRYQSETLIATGMPKATGVRSDEEFDFLAPPERPDEIGRLGDYRVLRVLGVGGMGVVFLAEDPRLKRQIALKTMKPAMAANKSAKDRFVREGQATAAIEHHHIVHIYQVGEEGGIPFIAMQFLRGESLQDRLDRENQLDHRDVAQIGREVAEGLAAAHDRGLIHRDIKPDNIWMEKKTGWAKILDFGLARSHDDGAGLTQTGMVLGTPKYMAPEQANGESVDHRCDLFSLGSVLYHLVSGKAPFEGGNLTATLLAVSQADCQPIAAVCPDLHPDLARLITELLSKERDARPTSAGQVAEALRNIEHLLHAGQSTSNSTDRPRSCQTSETASPRQSTVTKASAKPGQKARWQILAVGTAILGLVGVGLLVHWTFSSEKRPSVPTGPESVLQATDDATPQQPIHYRGKIDILVERTIDGSPVLMRLNDPGALPLQEDDKFRIEGEVDPPAFLYMIWVDPNHDVTPVYPWDPAIGWNSRPEVEEPLTKISLPANKGNRYTAPDVSAGVATMVLFACPTPLEASDDEVRGWFEQLPELPLPAGGETVAVWFDDYVEVRDPLRLRTFGVVGSNDPFAQWQGRLQEVLGDKASFQTAVNFARTGRK